MNDSSIFLHTQKKNYNNNKIVLYDAKKKKK